DSSGRTSFARAAVVDVNKGDRLTGDRGARNTARVDGYEGEPQELVRVAFRCKICIGSWVRRTSDPIAGQREIPCHRTGAVGEHDLRTCLCAGYCTVGELRGEHRALDYCIGSNAAGGQNHGTRKDNLSSVAPDNELRSRCVDLCRATLDMER